MIVKVSDSTLKKRYIFSKKTILNKYKCKYKKPNYIFMLRAQGGVQLFFTKTNIGPNMKDQIINYKPVFIELNKLIFEIF